MQNESTTNGKENAIKEWYDANISEHSNSIWLTGIVTKEFWYSHMYNGVVYYKTVVEVKRLSGTSDFIKVMVPYSSIKGTKNLKGMYIDVKGQMRSYRDKARSKPILIYLLAQEVRFCTEEEIGDLANINVMCLTGKIFKGPNHRFTPFGREITDCILKVCDKNERNIIPCIMWGSVARRVADLPTGTTISVLGRMQSRVYTKVLEDGTKEERTTYEMSASNLIEIET